MNINKSLFLIAPMLFVAFGFYLKIQDEGEDILMKAVNASLQGAHYDPAVINDEFSEKAFKLYLKNLDANKRLLSKSDMKQLDKFEKEIDDEIKNGTYNLFNASIKLVNKQTTLTEQFFEDILAQPFDFNINEEVDFDEEIPYAKNDKELKDRWRKYLKYSVLTKLYNDQLAQEKAEEKTSPSKAGGRCYTLIPNPRSLVPNP